MNSKLRYGLGALVSIPLLPIIYFQGKAVRKSVPVLPEAKGTEGFVSRDAEKTIRILTIGESTIAGVGVESHEEGFTGLLAKKLSELMQVNVGWRVYARSGYTAAKVKAKILNKIEEREADLLVIGLGGNDAFTLNRPSKWAQSIVELIAELQKKFPGTPIAFTNMPPIKEFPAFTRLIKFTIGNLVEIHGNVLSDVVKGFKNVFYNDEILLLEDWIKKLGGGYTSGDFFSDGVHPSKLTYQAWGKDFAEFIVREKVIS